MNDAEKADKRNKYIDLLKLQYQINLNYFDNLIDDDWDPKWLTDDADDGEDIHLVMPMHEFRRQIA